MKLIGWTNKAPDWLCVRIIQQAKSASMPFGEIVCGAPGNGKSTYCYGKHQLFTALQRPISIINLDPANENIVPVCNRHIVSHHSSGCDGCAWSWSKQGTFMLYCMEYLEANFDWLESRLHELQKDAHVRSNLGLIMSH